MEANQRKNLPFRRIILRNQREKPPNLEVKTKRVGSSTVGEGGYIRKLT
jgi:hypothetical protein